MTTLFIADDHPLVRKGLKDILQGEVDLEVIGEAENDQELLDGLATALPDVLITDLSMPGRGTLTVLTEVRARFPRLPILVLTMHPEERFAVRALRSGASGYLTKDTKPDEIIRAVRTLAGGKKYITPTLAEKLALELDRDPERPLHATLSNREYQIMRALASGKKIKDVADELSISIHTVNTYKARIMEKMNMKNITELTLYAIENHLIE